MKIAILASYFFLFTQILAQTNVTSVDRTSLFIYYDFDTIVNKIVPDLSGHGHNGTVVGNATLETGKFGKAIALHNELAGDQLVNAGPIDITGQTFTILAWVTVLPTYSNMTANMKVVSKKNTWDENAGFELQYNPAEKQITFLSSGSNLGTADNITLDSNWHHVAAIVNGTTVRIFVNGVDVTTDGDINAPVPNPGKDFLVGSSNLTAPAGGAWVGSIDEFRIYTTVLTPSQVMWVMNGSDIQTTPSPSTVPSPSTQPTKVPASPTTAPTIAPTTSSVPTTLPTVVVPIGEVSSAGTVTTSFIVIISVIFCIFMM